MSESPWSVEEFAERLRAVGPLKYHHKHPFHVMMHEGRLDQEQFRLWVANRFYYQKAIPIKDAAFLSRCDDRDVRRRWVERILEHDGYGDNPGGIERWLLLADAVGLSRDDLEEDRLLLPGVRYAVDAYVNFVRTRPWLEGAASSLTILFAPDLHARRIAALEKHYTWIDPAALAYFRMRLAEGPLEADFALSLVLDRCQSRQQQERALAALHFKSDLLWAQLDAMYYHCFVTAQDLSS